MSIGATLFDMDGLLIDSEVLWHQAEVEIFGALGVPLFESSIRSTKGVFVNEVVDYWYARYPWDSPSNDVVVDMLRSVMGFVAFLNSLYDDDGRGRAGRGRHESLLLRVSAGLFEILKRRP